jgi:hypothetical protein
MAGSPKKRQRREQAERASAGVRAQASDPATRQWALQRAQAAGDEVAATEAGVTRATIRSWRRRAKAEGTMPESVSVGAGAGVAAAVPAVAVRDEDELGRAEARLARLLDARDEALERSQMLQRQGNDVLAQASARISRDHAQAARAVSAEVRLLREAAPRIAQAEGERMIAAISEWARDLHLPWGASSAACRLFGERLRRIGSEDADGDDLAPLAADARSELRRVFGVTPAASVPVPAPRGEDLDVLDADDEVPADGRRLQPH